MTTTVVVTLAIFFAGLIFHAGQLSARLRHVEQRCEEHDKRLDKELDELKAMLRAAIGERRSWRERDDRDRGS